MKLIVLVLITIIAIGCGRTLAEEPSGTQKQPPPIAEAPKPTAAQPTPAPTPTTAPNHPAPTTVAPTLPQQYTGLVLSLEINEIVAELPEYDRADWRHWTDEDSDESTIVDRNVLAKELLGLAKR